MCRITNFAEGQLDEARMLRPLADDRLSDDTTNNSPPQRVTDYLSDEFRMYSFKIVPCTNNESHDHASCPFAHDDEKGKRRDPQLYNGVACPSMKRSFRCPRGQSCKFAHNAFEYWLHPTRYRTHLCNDGAKCKRTHCFFAHSLEELRDASAVKSASAVVGAPPSASNKHYNKTNDAAAPPSGDVGNMLPTLLGCMEMVRNGWASAAAVAPGASATGAISHALMTNSAGPGSFSSVTSLEGALAHSTPTSPPILGVGSFGGLGGGGSECGGGAWDSSPAVMTQRRASAPEMPRIAFPHGAAPSSPLAGQVAAGPAAAGSAPVRTFRSYHSQLSHVPSHLLADAERLVESVNPRDRAHAVATSARQAAHRGALPLAPYGGAGGGRGPHTSADVLRMQLHASLSSRPGPAEQRALGSLGAHLYMGAAPAPWQPPPPPPRPRDGPSASPYLDSYFQPHLQLAQDVQSYGPTMVRNNPLESYQVTSHGQSMGHGQVMGTRPQGMMTEHPADAMSRPRQEQQLSPAFMGALSGLSIDDVLLAVALRQVAAQGNTPF